jgi:hypothetical protein
MLEAAPPAPAVIKLVPAPIVVSNANDDTLKSGSSLQAY